MPVTGVNSCHSVQIVPFFRVNNNLHRQETVGKSTITQLPPFIIPPGPDGAVFFQGQAEFISSCYSLDTHKALNFKGGMALADERWIKAKLPLIIISPGPNSAIAP